jgi:secretion/DNA translocation related TadE-like protein
VTAPPDAGGGPGHPRHIAEGGSGHPRHVAAGARGERGGASLVALALAAFLLLAGLLAVDVGALVAARAAAQTAADMAALAALTPGGDAPPAKAAAIASANGAELAGCACSAVEAVVTVRRRVALAPTGLSVQVTARARAVLAAHAMHAEDHPPFHSAMLPAWVPPAVTIAASRRAGCPSPTPTDDRKSRMWRTLRTFAQFPRLARAVARDACSPSWPDSPSCLAWFP